MDNLKKRDEELESLKKIKNHLEEVKDSYLKAQEALPYVQHEIDLTNWRIKIRESMPPEGEEILLRTPSVDIEIEKSYLQGLYKVVDIPSINQMTSGTAITTSSTSTDFVFVNRVGEIGTSIAVQYSKEYIDEYEKIQDIRNRPGKIRILLSSKLNDARVLERFEEAASMYLAYRSGHGKRTAAANSIRNLIHSLKGILFAKASSHKGENMTWEIMSKKLTKNGDKGLEFKKLCEAESIDRQLLERLASVVKDMEGTGVLDLDAIWIGTLDHLFVILGLIE